MKKILTVVTFIGLLGIVGHFDMQDEISTAQYDKQNKQEVIKDLELKCMNGSIDVEYCNGVLAD